MAINVVSLNRAINNCFNGLKDYYLLCQKMNKAVYKYISAKTPNDDYYEKVKKYEYKSNDLYQEMCDSIAWDISKETPVAEKLRFFLAALSSLRDLERIADAAYNIVNTYKKQDVADRDHFKPAVELFEFMVEICNQIWEVFVSKDGEVTKKIYKKCQALRTEFHYKYNEVLHSSVIKAAALVLVDVGNGKDIETDESLLVDLSLMNKKIERNVDHLINIVEAFLLVSNENDENKNVEKNTSVH